MEPSQLSAHCGSRKLTRAELTAIPTPAGTLTHRPVPHHEIVGGLGRNPELPAHRRGAGRVRRLAGWHEDVRRPRPRNQL